VRRVQLKEITTEEIIVGLLIPLSIFVRKDQQARYFKKEKAIKRNLDSLQKRKLLSN